MMMSRQIKVSRLTHQGEFMIFNISANNMLKQGEVITAIALLLLLLLH